MGAGFFVGAGVDFGVDAGVGAGTQRFFSGVGAGLGLGLGDAEGFGTGLRSSRTLRKRRFFSASVIWLERVPCDRKRPPMRIRRNVETRSGTPHVSNGRSGFKPMDN